MLQSQFVTVSCRLATVELFYNETLSKCILAALELIKLRRFLHKFKV